jgi:chromate transporter
MSESGSRQSGQPSAAPSLAPRSTPTAGLLELFFLFSQLGLSSFGGGVSAWMHRAFVEQRGWIGETEFSAALALSRIMPGANVVNLAVVIGQRLRGAAGAAVAILGLLLGPSILVIGLAVVYDWFADIRLVQKMLEGTAAAAVGLILAMAVASARHLLRELMRSPAGALQSGAALAFMVAVFLSIGVLRLPLVPTVLCLAPFSIALTYLVTRRSVTGHSDDR